MARGYPDFEGDKAGLYSIPAWAAFEGYDRNFTVAPVSGGFNTGTGVAYNVPAGRTLYISHLSFRNNAFVAADADNNQICFGWIKDNTTGITLWKQGGQGGGGAIFNKPITIPSLHQVGFYVTNRGNHDCVYDVSAGCFEV